MNNPRMTVKERNPLKGAIRRVFSRSELRKKVLEASEFKGYIDPKRPRVKKWSLCRMCGTPTPTYLMQVDHIIPLVAIESSLEEMSWDEVVDRCWCSEESLQAICKDPCHKEKSRQEMKLRREYRKKVKNGQSK